MPLRSTLFSVISIRIIESRRRYCWVLVKQGLLRIVTNTKKSILWFIFLSGRAKNSSVFNDEPFRAYNKKQLVIVKDTLPQQSRLSQHSFYNSLTTNSFNNSSGIMWQESNNYSTSTIKQQNTQATHFSNHPGIANVHGLAIGLHWPCIADDGWAAVIRRIMVMRFVVVEVETQKMKWMLVALPFSLQQRHQVYIRNLAFSVNREKFFKALKSLLRSTWAPWLKLE